MTMVFKLPVNSCKKCELKNSLFLYYLCDTYFRKLWSILELKRVKALYWPILYHKSPSVSPDNIKKPEDFWFFQGTCKSSYRRCSITKSVLRNFATFTGKHLCWSIFLIKLQAFRFLTLNICERLLLDIGRNWWHEWVNE